MDLESAAPKRICEVPSLPGPAGNRIAAPCFTIKRPGRVVYPRTAPAGS